jgi:multiple sugar transport system ATP-binding protein
LDADFESKEVIVARVQLKNISKKWASSVAVQSMNLDIEDGEFVVLLGPSGCGKSTTMRMIAGLEEPTEGEIFINGQCVNHLEPKDRNIAMVFQSYGLYPNMTVQENIAFPLKIRGEPLAKIEESVRKAAGRVELLDFLNRKPKELSGGQRQRVALARAIVRQPQVFLMDEPLSNLDAKLRVSMRAHLKNLHSELGITTVYVTHDQIEAMTLADRVVVMSNSLIQQIDTPEKIYSDPANLFVAGFVGSPPMNLIKGKLRAGVFLAPGVQIPGFGNLTQDDVVLGVRSEDLSITTPDTFNLSGKVFSFELIGDSTLTTLTIGTDFISVRTLKDLRLTINTSVFLSADFNFCYLFDSITTNRIRFQA